MAVQLNLRPVIQACATNSTIIEAKAGDADDMQRDARGSAESSNVAGVGRNLRLDKRYADHTGCETARQLNQLQSGNRACLKTKGTTNFVEVFVVPFGKALRAVRGWCAPS